MKLKDAVYKPWTFGEPICIHGLGFVPLLAVGMTVLPNLELLEESIAKGTATITETSERGEVPFLRIENKGNTPILILEGEELVGGKQNPVVNTTIVVLGGSTLEVPVSCMESGSWDYRRRNFEAGQALFRAGGLPGHDMCDGVLGQGPCPRSPHQRSLHAR